MMMTDKYLIEMVKKANECYHLSLIKEALIAQDQKIIDEIKEQLARVVKLTTAVVDNAQSACKEMSKRYARASARTILVKSSGRRPWKMPKKWVPSRESGCHSTSAMMT